jgi:hypothetical protein
MEPNTLPAWQNFIMQKVGVTVQSEGAGAERHRGAEMNWREEDGAEVCV